MPVPTEAGDSPLSRAERLAALIEGKLSRAERAELIHILAASGTDRELLARVVLYLDGEEGGEEPGGG